MLEIENLTIQTVGNKPKKLVDNISLSMRRGDVLGLIGESGAGKSTLGLAAIGFTRSGCARVHGSVKIGDTDISALDPQALIQFRARKVGYVAQSAAATFNPAKRLLTQICEIPVRVGLMDKEAAESAAVDLFRRLLLPNPETFGRRYPHQVSGGQLQRAMLAMAMICRPALLVLDEPTTALDVTTQLEVLGIIRKLISEENVSALYITHDLPVVAQIANDALVLRNGRIMEYAAVRKIIENPTSHYTRALLEAQTFHTIRSQRKVSPAEDILEAEDIDAKYSEGPLVVRGVTLSLRRGETVGVIGESGSGKTTLLRVLSGLVAPARGTLRYKGHDLPPLRHRSREMQRRIQLLHQSPDQSMNPRHTVLQTLGRPLKLFHGMTSARIRQKVSELLELVELLPDIAQRYPRQLSGGQKQRVCIARALAAEPDILLCDEITAALDTIVAREVLLLLRRIQEQRGLSSIMISHDLSMIRSNADRIFIMNKGQFVRTGDSESVFQPPLDPYTQKLLAAIPQMRVGWLDDIFGGQKMSVTLQEMPPHQSDQTSSPHVTDPDAKLQEAGLSRLVNR